MANIILIENDPKLRAQVEALILELSPDHKVRFFSSSDEFEKLYFGEEKTVVDLRQEGPLANLEPALFNELCQQDLSQQAFSLGKSQPPKPLEELLKIISSAVMTDFQQSWSEWVDVLKTAPESTDERSSRQLVALNNKKGSVWVVEFFPVKKSGQALTLGFKDWTPDLRAHLQQQGSGADEDELRLFSSIQMIIARSTCLNPKLKTPAWVEGCFKQLSERGYSNSESRTCFMLLKYEDDEISKMNLLHPLIDDLIYLPLDRPLFLQKTDILLGLPGSVTPRFLFNQQAQIDIEISKISQVDFLSEVGLRIRNPVPLVKGLAAHFYLTLPQEQYPLDLFGKVTEVTPHPEIPGQFLVEFHFFGLSPSALRSLRLYLRTHQGYRSLRNEDGEQFRFQKDNIFLDETERKPKQVVLIDVDESFTQQIKTAFLEDMDQVQVLSASSYYFFLKKYLEGYTPQGDWEWASEEDLYSEVLTWTLDTETKKIIQVSPQPNGEDQLLGHSAKDLLSPGGPWEKLFSDSLSEIIFQESVEASLGSGETLEQRLLLNHAEGALKMMELKISPTDKEGQVLIELKAPPAQSQSRESDAQTFDSLDLLIINQALLPQDIQSWWLGFQEAAKTKGLIPPHLQVPVVVTAKEGKVKPLEPFLQAPIEQFMIFSGESRSLLMASAHLMGHPFTRYCPQNIVWQKTRLPIHIAKTTLLEQVAEFGASIRHPRPIQPGTFLYLRGSIFDQAPNQNLCARFYRTEPHPSEPGEHLCHLLYFGINDSFLKFTRSWFRETYAASKQGD